MDSNICFITCPTILHLILSKLYPLHLCWLSINLCSQTLSPLFIPGFSLKTVHIPPLVDLPPFFRGRPFFLFEFFLVSVPTLFLFLLSRYLYFIYHKILLYLLILPTHSIFRIGSRIFVENPNCTYPSDKWTTEYSHLGTPAFPLFSSHLMRNFLGPLFTFILSLQSSNLLIDPTPYLS